MDGEIIKATFKKTNRVRTAPQWRYNHGQTLVFENVDLPEVYEVHFSNTIDGEAKTCLGGPDGVHIPSEYFLSGCEIYAWIFVTEGDVGITKKEVIIPIDDKGRPTDQEPLPEERTIIDQTVSKLNDVINNIPNVIEEALTEAKESGEFDGPKGDKGDPFTYNDFTPEQLEALTGPKGDPFTYEDFTPEQLESLRGPKGDPFTYDDFTPEQLEELQGPEGSTIWTTTHSYSKPVVDGHYYFANSHLTGPATASKKIGDLVVMSNSTDGEYKCFSIRNFLYEGVLIDTKFVCNMQGPDGVSPTVRTVAIEGGTRVIITDKDGTKSFDVMNGEDVSEIVYFYGYISNPALFRVSFHNFDFYRLRDCINAGKTPVAVVSVPSRHPAKDSYDHEAIDNEKEYLVMPLAEWYKDKADTVPSLGDTVPWYTGVYATFVSTIQNSSYTLKLEWDLLTMNPARNDWVWTLVPTVLADASDINQNVKYFDFTINYDIEYSDYSNDVTTVCTIPDIQDAYDKGYAILAKLNDRATTYILPLVISPNNYGQTIDGQGQIIFEGYWQVMFGAETRIPVANSASPEGLESVYRIILDCDTHRPDGHMWRVYWNEVNTDQDSGDMSAYRTAADQDLIDNGLSDAIDAKYTKPLAGIPKTDLAADVQTSLDKADNALPKNQGVANAGKFMVVGSNGNVEPAEMLAMYLDNAFKNALITLAKKVAYVDAEGQNYYKSIHEALYPAETLDSITAEFDQDDLIIYDNTPLNELKRYLVVTAEYSDASTEILMNNEYALSGVLSAGTCTVTVTYGLKTTSFEVDVAAMPVVTSISAVYDQSGIVYDDETLSNLKADLVVRANYSDASTTTLQSSSYSLSGTLADGTSVVTVSYLEFTTTFTVEVDARAPLPSAYQKVEYIQNTSNAWIYPTSTHEFPAAFRIEAKTKLDGYNEGAKYGMIAANFQPGQTNYGMYLAYRQSNNTVVIFTGNTSSVKPSNVQSTLIVGAICDGQDTQVYMLVDGVRITGAKKPIDRIYDESNWGIFYGGTGHQQFVGKIYWLRLYDSSDNMLEEWIPCYRKSDGEIGMFETVSQVFYANSNTSDSAGFIKGGDI